jgi:hypothetical protein
MRVSIFIAGLLAAVAHASPLSTTPSNLKQLRSIPHETGKIVFYGVDSPLKEAATNADISRRATCGDNIVSCDKKHEAYTNTCDTLGSYLIAHRDDQVSSKDRSICHELDGNNRCCVSWATGIDFAVRDLISAFDASRRCDGAAHENLISARATYTLLAGKCNTQCLSNQGGASCRN